MTLYRVLNNLRTIHRVIQLFKMDLQVLWHSLAHPQSRHVGIYNRACKILTQNRRYFRTPRFRSARLRSFDNRFRLFRVPAQFRQFCRTVSTSFVLQFRDEQTNTRRFGIQQTLQLEVTVRRTATWLIFTVLYAYNKGRRYSFYSYVCNIILLPVDFFRIIRESGFSDFETRNFALSSIKSRIWVRPYGLLFFNR